MTDKASIVRFTHAGEKFEILVKPNPALDYKTGKISDLSKVLISDEIYSDSNKGTRASRVKLQKAFQTQNVSEIADIIMNKGSLNLTTDQRRHMVDEKRKQIIDHIAKTYVDPRTKLPHPPLRIEQALKDARISIDPDIKSEEQVKDIVEGLRTIIALKSENLDLDILIPAQYASKSYSVLKSVGTLKNEEWQTNGSLKAILEIPAAVRPTVIDKLGSVTKGTASVEVCQ